MTRLAGIELATVLLAFTALGGEPVLGTGDAARATAETPNPDARPVNPPSMQAQSAETQSTDAESQGGTVVIGEREWAEDRRSGAYRQPAWTDRRRFPGTRVYVAPPGSFTFEFWLENRTPFDGDPVRWRTLYEVAVGLGHRLQLDFYMRTEQLGLDVMRVESERIELRWALADWGSIWGNPTIYLEWIRKTKGPMKGEVKVLLGDSITSRLYWGANVLYERELWGDDQTQEYGATGGLSYSLIENKLSLGGEFRLKFLDVRRSRPAPTEIELLAGPTMMWRPVPQAHLLLVWFLGSGFKRDDGLSAFTSRLMMQPTLVLGWRL
jgi:hypothetical protein